MDPDPDKSINKRGNRGMPATWQYVPHKRRLLPEDPFYEDGNVQCSIQHKQMPIEEEKPAGLLLSEFPCHVSGCSVGSFTAIQDYEIHYNSAHRNVCSTCNRVFPSNHLLDIHVVEWHDALFQVLAHKQPMFLCLVQACGIKFSTAEERKVHLVKEHHYPRDFRFDRRAKTKGNLAASQAHIQDTQPEDDCMDIGVTESQRSTGDTVITSSNKQYRVPRNICFGRGGARTFQRPHPKPQHSKRGNKTDDSSKTPKDNSAIFISSQPQVIQVSQESHGCQHNEPEAMESQVSMDSS